MLQFIFLVLLVVLSAVPQSRASDCQKNITLTAAGFSFPKAQIPPYTTCYYNFAVPSGYYAAANVSASGLGRGDHIYLYDHLEDRFVISDGDSHSRQSSTSWPTDFSITYNAGMDSVLNLQFSVSLQPYPKVTSAGTDSTTKNGLSKLVYFNDFAEGTSYTFTSSSNVYLQVAAAFFSTPKEILQNVFVYSNDDLLGTLNYLTSSKAFINASLTVVCVKKVPLQGAIFVTDYANVKGIEGHTIEYVPLDQPQETDFWGVSSYTNVSAVTIIGNKDGSTPFDVRQIFLNSPNSSIAVIPGSGPVAQYSNATQLFANKVPYHFSGVMNTFYGWGGYTTFKYSITSN